MPVTPRPERGTSLDRCLESKGIGPVLLALVCFLAFFLGLGSHHLFDPDEGRSAEVAREMLVSGHWLVPTLNFDRFHDKPAFYYWTIAASMRLFGASDWAVRFPGVVAATLSVIVTGAWAGRYLGRGTGILSALILATTVGFIGVGCIALTDATFSWWLIAALFYGGGRWLERPGRAWPAWPLHVLLALAVLTKGPAALVLAALVFVAFAWSTNDWAALRTLRPIQGIVILVVVAGTWYGAASVVAPDYVWNFLWTQNVGRYVAGRGGHSASVFTFLFLLPAACLPWSLYFPVAAAALRRSARRTGLGRPVVFCLLWAAVVVGFFSLGRSKLVTYVLPAFPPVAILLAITLRGTATNDGEAIPRWVHRAVLGALCGVSVVGSLVLLVLFREYAPVKAARALAPLVGLVPLVLGLRRVAAGRHAAAVWAVIVFAITNAVFFHVVLAPALNDAYSLERPARLVLASSEQVALYTYRTSAYSLQYYARCRTYAVRTPAEAGALLAGDAPVVLLTRNRHLNAIRGAVGAPVNVWWQGPRSQILISNRAVPRSPLS